MPKKDPQNEDELAHPGLPDLGFDDSTLEQKVNEPEEGEKAPRNDELSTLRAELEGLKGRLTAVQEQNMALMATPVAKVAPRPPAQLNMDGLPDPALDSTAYGTELARRMAAQQADNTRYQQEVAQQQSQTQGRAQALWADFELEYEDYAADQRKVEFATTNVLKKQAARGVDMDRYMYGHSQKFMADVVKEYDSIFGKPSPDGEEEEIEAKGRTGTKARKVDRTGGMIGGSEGGSKSTKSRQPAEDDMFADIKKFQQANGFY